MTPFLGEESLHADVPNRSGELFIKRELIQKSLKILILKGLVEVQYTQNGIEYVASEEATPFIDNLSEFLRCKKSNI